MTNKEPLLSGKVILHGDQWYAERKIYEDGTMTTEALLTPAYDLAFQFMLTGSKDDIEKHTRET
tara:strand:+ start:452 stop:643 length:192 start_codon:yes stop_codon:yes gene_type:complete